MNDMGERIKITKTPKLGSLKETLKLVKKIRKEYSRYNKNLMKESTSFFLNAIKARKYLKLVKNCIKEKETIILSPKIMMNDQNYNVIRYGPSFISVLPPGNKPRGFTVIDHEDKIEYNLDLCKKICNLYNIWETHYFSPLKTFRVISLIQWESNLKTEIFNDISYRRQSGYHNFEGSEEEQMVLQELDDEVYQFHEADMELLMIEEKLNDLQFTIFKSPSETNINEFIQIISRFNELIPLEKEYLERRINAWKKYKNLLERKYKVKVNLNLNMTDLGLAAFIDVMKYVLMKRIIPEAVLSRLSIQVIKDVGGAIISESLLNLIVHYGGLTSLEKQLKNHEVVSITLKKYLKISEFQIPDSFIRFP